MIDWATDHLGIHSPETAVLELLWGLDDGLTFPRISHELKATGDRSKVIRLSTAVQRLSKGRFVQKLYRDTNTLMITWAFKAWGPYGKCAYCRGAQEQEHGSTQAR